MASGFLLSIIVWACLTKSSRGLIVSTSDFQRQVSWVLCLLRAKIVIRGDVVCRLGSLSQTRDHKTDQTSCSEFANNNRRYKPYPPPPSTPIRSRSVAEIVIDPRNRRISYLTAADPRTNCFFHGWIRSSSKYRPQLKPRSRV